ncbi:MAG: hypothetical protein PHR30_01765 [Gallionellaceae bacterium]|nr:hypothetical protein [Gallionellaceae bacterium]
MKALRPTAGLDALFPPGTVLAPRTSLDHMRWVYGEPYRPDSATGFTMAVMGDMPLICHRATATPEGLEFFRRCGIQPPARLDVYADEAEFIAAARDHLRHGKRLAYIYPPLAELDREPGLLVPPPLYGWLNDKTSLADLVDDCWRPAYRYLRPADLHRLPDALPDRVVFVKACHAGASGSGTDVRHCPDAVSREAAIAWLAPRLGELSGVLVEEAVPVRTCWCLNLTVLDHGVRYLGAAAQLFSAPALQSGSLIDPDDLPPERVVAIALAIAERSRMLGYRGIAGFDVGITPDGRPCVFDLNFRLAASTPLVLLHAPATARIGARVSLSWHGKIKGSLAAALEVVAPDADAGRFVPFRLYEATAASDGDCLVTGMVVADSAQAAEDLAAEMHARFAGTGG